MLILKRLVLLLVHSVILCVKDVLVLQTQNVIHVLKILEHSLLRPVLVNVLGISITTRLMVDVYRAIPFAWIVLAQVQKIVTPVILQSVLRLKESLILVFLNAVKITIRTPLPASVFCYPILSLLKPLRNVCRNKGEIMPYLPLLQRSSLQLYVLEGMPQSLRGSFWNLFR